MLLTIDPVMAALAAFVICAAYGMMLGRRRDRAMQARQPTYAEWWSAVGSRMARVEGEDDAAFMRRLAAHAFDCGFELRDDA